MSNIQQIERKFSEMKNSLKNNMHNFFVIILIIGFASSCKKNNDYRVSGNVILATTGEPIEGVLVEVYHKACDIGVPCWHQESHFATTDSQGKYETLFKSKETQMEKNFSKEFLYLFNSGENRFITPGSSLLNNTSLFSQTEEFTIEFEPTLTNVKEVSLDFEWDRFRGNDAQTATLESLSSIFTIRNYYISSFPSIPFVSLGFGEQWLKINFDILFEDNSRVQKTDSIWLPGRYYDINDYDFGDPRRHPVYKFAY